MSRTPATDCERRDEIGEKLIGLLEAMFGAEPANVWRDPES